MDNRGAGSVSWWSSGNDVHQRLPAVRACVPGGRRRLAHGKGAGVAALIALALLLSCAAGCREKEGLSAAERRRAERLRREKLARPRRHIMNCDTGHLRYPRPGYPETVEPGDRVDPEKLLQWRFLGHENTPVDTITLDTGTTAFGVFTHRTQVAQIVLDRESAGLADGDRTHIIVGNMKDQGTDHLEIVADWCRENDLEIFWMLRMNDTHDAWGGRKISDFKRERAHWLVGSEDERPPHGHWTALDYGREELREMVFRVIEEVCLNYEIDGLELDFWRYPLLFKSVAWGQKAGEEEREAMTHLMRRVREMADRVSLARGEAILIAVRVPDSVGYCRDIGIDLERWLAEDLVDILIPGGDFRLNEWEYSVELGRRYGVKVYPSLEVSRVGGTHMGGSQARRMRQSRAGYAARAANALNAGADGIHTFNLSWSSANDPRFEVLGTRKLLEGVDKFFFANYKARQNRAGFYVAGGERHVQIETLSPDDTLILRPGQSEEVMLYFGEDIGEPVKATPPPELAAYLYLDELSSPGEISVKLNGRKLEGSIPRDKNLLRYPLAPSQLNNGLNTFEIHYRDTGGAEHSPQSGEWEMLYRGDRVMSIAEGTQLPWRRLTGAGKRVEAVRDGALYLADEGTEEGEKADLMYPWRIEPADGVVVETRVKVEESSDPLAVAVRLADGNSVEYLTLEENAIGLYFAGRQYEMDTTADFNVYRIVIHENDIKVYADGKLVLDGSGKFTTPSGDESNWIKLYHGKQDWNRRSLMFGSASGPGTGAAYWDYIGYRTHTPRIQLYDLKVSVKF